MANTLVGTEKQIAWAESIREKAARNFREFKEAFLDVVDDLYPESRELPSGAHVSVDLKLSYSPQALNELENAVSQIEGEVLAQTDAAWWISKKGLLGSGTDTLMAFLAHEIKRQGLAPLAESERDDARSRLSGV